MILFQKLYILCYFLSIHMLFFLIGHICQYLLLSSLNSNRKCQLIFDKSWLNNSPQNSCLSAFAKKSFFSFLFLSEDFKLPSCRWFSILDKEKLCTYVNGSFTYVVYEDWQRDHCELQWWKKTNHRKKYCKNNLETTRTKLNADENHASKVDCNADVFDS